VITHRPALLRLADSAVLMVEGRIAVQGVPADTLDISACKLPPPERAVHRKAASLSRELGRVSSVSASG
jgi:ABC-type protease/lipase transport system fused ATPase/permease subunit